MILKGLSSSTALSRQTQQLVSRRFLGNAARGPKITDIKGNLDNVLNLCKPTVSYNQFKSQSDSLRLFLFIGVSSYVIASLSLCPPKSSYWLRLAPWRIPTRIYEIITQPAQEIFHSKEMAGESWAAYKSAITR
eukprot:GHVR01003106.1.p1 GENE.GHVR01003106.1~~GHVR01003106.1.p1  ORF type:complete len:134 (+),score=14.58 GHVR01003106.1:49-450(+)